MFQDIFLCGPLEIVLTTENLELREKFSSSLVQYDAHWNKPYLQVKLNATETAGPATMAEGNYLTCARMNVDLTQEGVTATCRSGFSASYSAEHDRWDISITPVSEIPAEYVRCDIDDLIGLVLTMSWRHAGWIPIHSGAVAHSKSCAIVCAPSGGGKTTLITALIRRGWTTLGDDRLLLRIGNDGQPELGALLHSFNLDPNARKWFPEVNNLETMPTHTSFSEKRRIRIDDFWPKRAILKAEPTHILQLVRDNVYGIHIDPLSTSQILPILLTQTVIPNHAPTANNILSTMAVLARQLKSLRLEVGENAYGDSQSLSELEVALG